MNPQKSPRRLSTPLFKKLEDAPKKKVGDLELLLKERAYLEMVENITKTNDQLKQYFADPPVRLVGYFQTYKNLL